MTAATRETFLSETTANTTIAEPSLSFSLSAKSLKSFAGISKTSVAKTFTPLTSIALDKSDQGDSLLSKAIEVKGLKV